MAWICRKQILKIDYRVKPDNDTGAGNVAGVDNDMTTDSDMLFANDTDSEEEPDDSSWAWL